MTALFDRAYSLQATAAILFAGLLIGYTATYNPKYCVLLVGGLALVVVTLLNLTIGIVILTLLSFFERIPALSGAPLSKPLGLVLLAAWLVTVTRSREVRVPLLTRDHPLLSFFLVALVVWGLSSAAWATDPYTTLTSALRLALVVVLFFIIYTAVRTERDLLLVTWAFLAGAFLVSISAIVNGTTVEGRLSGGLLDPNYLAAILASSIVVSSFLLPSSGTTKRLVLLGFIAVYAVALVETQSRGGLIATGVALIVACIVAGPVRTQTIALVVVIVSVGLTYYAVFAPASLKQRVTDVSQQGSASRTDTWQIALHVASDHPLLGAGLGNFPVIESRYIPDSIDLLSAKLVLNTRLVVHNTYFELLAELGVVGFGLFIAVLLSTIAVAWRGIQLMDPRRLKANLAARGLLAGTIGLLVAYIFLSGEYEKQLWLLLGLLATIPNVARSTTAR